MNDEEKPKGIASYVERLKSIPPGPTGGLTVSPVANAAANTQQQIPAKPRAQVSTSPAKQVPAAQSGLATGPNGAGASDAAGGLSVKSLNVAKTSQPGISKVTGAGLSSPLFTNEGDAGQAVAGLSQRMAGSGITAPAATGTNPLSGPSAGVTITPFGGVNATNSHQAPQNEGLARMARANAITQERIDALPRGGSAALPDQNAAWNARMERSRQIEDVASLMARNPQVSQGIAAAFNAQAGNVSEETRQKGIAAGINTQRRGQDMNYGAQMAQMGLTARAQDQDAAMGNAKLGIDMAKFGLEQSAMQRQQSAQDNLFRAMDGGDQNTIAKARMMATMAGVKLPEATKMEPIQTDSGFMVFNPTSGEMRPAVGAEGQPVGSGKPLTEGQAKAAGFGMRAAESSRIIEEVGKGGAVQPSLIKRAAEGVPLIGEWLGMMANRFASPEQQQIEQAQRDFINAVLRQESGAVIADSEFANSRKQYFQQPGDSPEVIEQKARNRETAINGFRVTAGPGAKSIGNPPAQQQPQQGQQQSAAAPVAGTVDGGYVFLGGNPNDPNNWVEARK